MVPLFLETPIWVLSQTNYRKGLQIQLVHFLIDFQVVRFFDIMDEAKVGRVGFTEFHNFVEAAVQVRGGWWLSMEIVGKTKWIDEGDSCM